MSYINIISSSSHLLNPFHGPVNGERVRASLNSYNKIVVLVAGVVIPILGAVIAFYLLTAQLKLDAYRKKFKVIPADVIKNGAGEFIVSKGDRENLTPEEYEKAFEILEKYSPAHFHQDVNFKIREELILEELKKKIDLSCQITFIPRTLYDIIAIQKVLKEALDAPNEALNRDEEQTECQRFLRFKGAQFEFSNEAIIINKKFFSPETYQGEDPDFSMIADKHKECPCKNHGVRSAEYVSYLKKSTEHTAHKINKIFLEKITSQQLNFSELKEMTKKEIKAIKESIEKNKKSIGNQECALKNIKKIIPKILDGVVENALELECSEVALKNTFLFRGANIAHDSPFNLKLRREQSLSYGTSLFAGIFKDVGATSMSYMHGQNDAFALHISFSQIASAPFHVKLEHPLEQLWGKGEWFHSRSKVSSARQMTDFIHGVSGDDADCSYKKNKIISTLSLNELVKKIKHYYRNNLIKLK
jgi:phosphate/sulfate permease